MHGDSLVTHILTFLAAAVVIVSLAPRLRVSPLVGYLGVGLLLGPHLLGAVAPSPELEKLAELGVVFLLFNIGLELSWERLKLLRGLVFGLGGLQVLATMAVIAAVLLPAGVGWQAALVLGGALAMSSTAMVLQLLRSSGELASRAGQVMLAILLLQDLAIVPLLALAHALAGEPEQLLATLAGTFARAAVATAAVLLLGRWLLTPFFRLVAGSGHRDLLVATALLVVIGAGWLMTLGGLSMALGAFLAGLLLSRSEFRHQVEADLNPFRGLSLGLFFIYVGLALDLEPLLRAWPLVLAGWPVSWW